MGKRAESEDIDTLRRNVEWALRNALDADEVLPMLAKLARSAEPESDAWVLAHRHLAELGVAQTLLGNYRYAVSSYRRAIALAPQNPWYAHNLGHLLDVALGRPNDAVGLLAEAYKREPKEAEIASSYAHALARAGKLAQAKKVLRRVVAKGATAEQMILWRWLEQGAPPTKSAAKGGPTAPRPKPRKRPRAAQPARRS